MALRLKNGAVFLHIPKTGGNWITKILEELDLVDELVGHKHADFYHYVYPHVGSKIGTLKSTIERIIKPAESGKTPFMFCFVREPLSWYESWFKYNEQPRRQWMHCGDENDIFNWHPNSVLNGLGNCSFPEFVQNVNKKRPGYVTELYGWYTKSQVDFVGKQENLVDDLIKVLKMMNLDFDEEFIRNYGKVGESPRPEKKVEWPEDLRLETEKLEYAGLCRYGYK